MWAWFMEYLYWLDPIDVKFFCGTSQWFRHRREAQLEHTMRQLELSMQDDFFDDCKGQNQFRRDFGPWRVLASGGRWFDLDQKDDHGLKPIEIAWCFHNHEMMAAIRSKHSSLALELLVDIRRNSYKNKAESFLQTLPLELVVLLSEFMRDIPIRHTPMSQSLAATPAH